MSARNTVSLCMMVVCCLVFVFVTMAGIFTSGPYSPLLAVSGVVGLLVLAIVAVRNAGESDYVQARQSNRTLDLASQTLPYMSQGLSVSSAQEVCELIFPSIDADAVAITDRDKILGFMGDDKESHQPGTAIQSATTRETLEDGATRIVESAKEVGFTKTGGLHAGVIAPLVVDKHIVGTLKFYYHSATKLNETQKAIAGGMAQLLSTQLSLAYLQQQTELAARMELRALQAQINPHFLFNTINTIAATVRTNPEKARVMLREFAVYYRRLLENSEDLIPLAKEIEQTERYLMFQKARFGEDMIVMDVDIESGLGEVGVPSFILQPIVENAVAHGRRPEDALHIKVKVSHASDSVIISVTDDGVGIESERLGHLVEGGSKTGMGIALKNVNARLKACFGAISGIYIDSTLGEGTTVYLSLYDALVDTGGVPDPDGIIEEATAGLSALESAHIIADVGAEPDIPHAH